MTNGRVLIRVGRPPHQPVSLEAAHAYRTVGTMSTNPGNLLFQDAVYRTLATPGTDLVADSLATERRGVDAAHIERINDEFDRYVVPLANAFRDDFLTPLNRLSAVIEQLRIPVVVTGVGAQLPVDGDPRTAGTEIDEATTRFVRAVLECSESIGVRGELTKGYLVHLGFPEDRIDIIGCPSMHINGPDAVVAKPLDRLTTQSRLAINLTPSVPQLRAFLDHHHERYPHLTYIAQDNETLGLLLWGEEFESPPGMPGTMDHYLYREDKIRLFADPPTWLEFLRSCDFACGSRIHGNVAALMAGIPAFLLAHDSRTLELAEFHQIPYELIGSTDSAEDLARLDAAALYERTDLTALNRVRGRNHAAWLAFLTRNGLRNTWEEPNPELEAAIAAARFAPAARPISADAPTELAARLRWLRQGLQEGDRLRTHGAYAPEFIPQDARQESTLDKFRRLRERLAAQARQLDAQQLELQALTGRVEEQQKQLAGLLAPKPSLARRAGHRVRRMLGGSR